MYNSHSLWTARALRAALLGSVMLAGAAPSFAADLGGSIKDEQVYVESAPRFSWRGFYLGGTAGAAWDNRSVEMSPGSTAAIPYFTGGAVPGSLSGSDGARFIGGGQAGYNWQSGTLVYGVEVDYSGLAGNGDRGTVVTNAPGFATFNTTASAKVDQLATLRARLGWTVGAQTLLYVTGGFAAGHTNLSSNITTPGIACSPVGQCASGSEKGWKGGWTVGGGIEHALSNRWTIKGEYLHYDLGSTSFSAADPGSPGIVYTTKGKFEGDIVRAGVNFKF